MEWMFRVTTIQKKMLTRVTRLSAMITMMATSLATTDRCRRGLAEGSVIRSADEAVPHSPHRADERGPFRRVAQLLSQPAHEHVDRAIERLPVDAVRAGDDPVPAQDASPIAHQEAEQLELRRRQLQDAPVQPGRARSPVHLQRPGAHYLMLFRRAAAQHRLHP